MKACFKCGIEKPLGEFYVDKRMADGHLNKCKVCKRADVKERSSGWAKDAVVAYDRQRAMLPKRVEARKAYSLTDAGKQARKIAVSNYAKTHPGKRSAQHALNNAVRDKRMVKWPACAVPTCSKAPEAHHPDYSRPLDVVWLCPAHHRQAHALTRLSTP